MTTTMHYLAVVLFIVLICLTSWGWLVFPVDAREQQMLKQEQAAAAALPKDAADQEPLDSPEYDLGGSTGLRIE